MKFLIIAGHGAGDPGACCGSLKESELTRELAGRMVSKLPDHAALYPTDRNAYKDVKAGALKAADFQAYDYVLELHFNAVKQDAGDGKIKGVECYVPTGQKDPFVAQNLCAAMKELGFTNRGVKRKDFAVIHTACKAGVPAALLEVCFLDDADDMALYDLEDTAEALADMLAASHGIELMEDAAWTWCVEQGLLMEPARNRVLTGAELAEVLYKLHGGEG